MLKGKEWKGKLKMGNLKGIIKGNDDICITPLSSRFLSTLLGINTILFIEVLI